MQILSKSLPEEIKHLKVEMFKYLTVEVGERALKFLNYHFYTISKTI